MKKSNLSFINFIKNSFVVLTAVAVVAGGFFVPSIALATEGVSITTADGGGSVSIDTTSAPGGTPTWTTLDGPTITESAPGEILVGDHTITLPSGWEFNTEASIVIAKTRVGVSPTSVVPSSQSFTFHVSSLSSGSAGSLTFINLQVRPTVTTVSSGDMTYTGDGITGVTPGEEGTSFGTLTTIPSEPASLKIENSATGGTEIDTATVQSGSALTTAYANTRDHFGNFVANVAATWSLVGSSGGVLDGNLVPAGDTKSAVFTGNLVGTTVIQAVGSFTDTTGVITVVSGPVSATNSSTVVDGPGSVVVSNPGGAEIHKIVTVTAKDTAGNLISGKTVVVSATGDQSSNTITPVSPTTDANGVATFTISSTKAESKTITATVDGVPITSSTPTVIFTHDVAHHLSITTQPSTTATAGVAFVQQPVINVLDQFGNLVTDSSAVITATKHSDADSDVLKGTLTATASGGIATFVGSGLNYEKATTITIDFSSENLTPATSGSIAVSPNIPATVTFTQQPASTGTVDNILTTQPVVRVVDAYGNNVVDGTSVILTKASGAGTLRGTLTRTTSGGTATFNDIGYNKVDAFTITATAGVSATSDSVGPLSAGIINSFTLFAVSPQVAGNPFSVSVTNAIDQYSNPASGTVAVSASTGGGNSPSGATPAYETINVTNGSGAANTTLVKAIDTVLRGTVGSVTSDTGTITVSAGIQTKIILTSDKTNINANGTDTATLTAQLEDILGNNNLTSEVSIVFTSPRGTIVTSPVLTGGNGQAETAFNSGDDKNSGDVVVTASSGDLTAGTVTITFNDVTAPNAPVITTPGSSPVVINIANKSSQTLSGTAEAGSTVKIWVDGGATTVTTMTDESGDFAFTNTELQTAGIVSGTDYSSAKVITVKATDAAANTSEASNSISYTQDTTAPYITTYDKTNTIFSPNGDSSKDTSSLDLAFSEASVVYDINVLNSEGTKVRDLNEGTAQDPVLKTWNGKSNSDTVVADGTYTVQVIMTDSAGNPATDTSYNNVQVDTQPSTIALTYSTDPAKAGAMTVTATYSEPAVGTPQISINQPGTTDISNASMSGSGTVWTYAYTVTAANGAEYVDGEATVSLSAVVDAAGNTAAVPTNETFTIDTTAPSIDSVTAPVADDVYKTSVPVGFTPNDAGSGAVTCAYTINGGSGTSFDCTKGDPVSEAIPTSDFVDGRNTLTLTVTDAAGNSTSVTLDSFVVDTNNMLTVAAAGADFTTIQGAINKATSGDTVNVAAGTYNVQLSINKALTLNGANVGINAVTGTRSEETTINAPGTTAINVLVQNVTIDGFTINASIGIYAEATSSAEDLAIKNNIITGTTRSVSVGGGGGADTLITGNDLISTSRSLHLSGSGPYTNLKVNNNRFSGAANTGIQFLGNVPINGFEFKNNDVEQLANLGSTITNGTVSGNTFEIIGESVLGLQINLHSSTITGNAFDGNSTGACLQLFGSQYGLPASNDVTVLNNTFTDCGANAASWNYAIQLSQDIRDITITNNTITNAYDAFNTRVGTDGSPASWDLSTNNIHINNNSITGSTHLAVNNTVTGTLDATKNWFGTTDNAIIATKISTFVDYRPWRILNDLTYTVDATGPSVTVDSTASSPTNLTSIPVTIHFSENAFGFTADDVAVTNGTKGALSGSGADYTINITPTDAGDVTVKVNASTAWDESGNYNSVSNTLTRTYDNAVPTLSTVTTASNNSDTALAKVGDTVTLTLIASENLTSKPTITISTHAIDAGNVVQGSDAQYWTATYVMASGDTEGVVPFTINFSDIAGNAGTPVSTKTGGNDVTFDRTAPVVALTSISGDNYINNSEKGAIVVVGTAEANALVSVSLTNGATVSGTEQLSGGVTAYSITINGTSLSDGTITPSVTATDAAGNVSTAVITPTATKDITVPTVTSKTPNASAVGIDPTTNITVVFSENIVMSSNGAQVTLQKGSDAPVSTVVAGSGTTTATINPAVTLDNNSTYTITLTGVTDTVGNTLPTTSWVFTTSASYSIALTTGWNLISLPVVPTDTAASAVLGATLNDATKIETVWKYDPVAGEWGAYHPGNSETSNFSTMTAGEGYWINYLNSGAGTIAGTGNLFQAGNSTPPQKTLAAGWNLIGYYQLENIVNTSATNALSTVSGQWTQLRTYSNTDKQFQAVTGGDDMKPGEGYWIFMKSSSYAPYLYGPGDTD